MKTMIANLKEHQNLGDAVTWINQFVNCVRNNERIQDSLRTSRLHIIIAPSFPFLITYKTGLQEFQNIEIGSQDISLFPKGSFTGEVGSHALKGIASYSIIGHSERRANFHETNETVRKKVENAVNAGIKPIVCFRSMEDFMTVTEGYIAYEPADAIGGGKNYPLETVTEFRRNLQLNSGVQYLYGGSVDEQNVGLYLKSEEVDGLLIGGASLDASHFCEMLKIV